MSPARIIVLVIALVAGLGAALLMRGPSAPKQEIAVDTTPTTDVLVAAGDVPLGNALAAGDIRWIPWPKSAIPAGVITRDAVPDADREMVGQLARVNLVALEPLRRERLIKTDGTGFLAAVLPSGKRAIAISTDNKGAATAGGFILPNDRVDVIRTVAIDSGGRGGEVNVTDTILTNVRVLAIGQNIQERNGEKVVIGDTATLELDAKQVETIVLAQKTGSLSLSLRSLQDVRDDSKPAEDGLTLVRFGVTSRSGK